MSRHAPPTIATLCDDVPFVCSTTPDDAPWSCAPLDVEAFADLMCDAPTQAAACLANLSQPQRTTQALAHAAWLCEAGIAASFEQVANAFDALLDGSVRSG